MLYGTAWKEEETERLVLEAPLPERFATLLRVLRGSDAPASGVPGAG